MIYKKTFDAKYKTILFANDASTIFTNTGLLCCKNDIGIEFKSLNTWFQASWLLMNFGTTRFLQLTIKIIPQTDLNMNYANKLISKVCDTKFLGIYTYTVHCTLYRKINIAQITHKLSAAWYAIGSVKPFMSWVTLKMVYYAYFHSITNYVLIFWMNSSQRAKIIKLQLNVIRIITGCRNIESQVDIYLRI